MLEPSQFQLHLFDLDDTLINTKEAYTQAQLTALKAHYPYLPPHKIDATFNDLKAIIATVGSGHVELYLRAYLNSFDLFPSPSQNDFDKLIQLYQNNFYQRLSAFSGVQKFLNTLVKNNHLIALISNGKVASQYKKLEVTGLNTYFNAKNIYISEQFPVEKKKPSPAMIQKAITDFKVTSKTTIFYGDKKIDMIAGNLAHVSTVLFSPKNSAPINFIKVFQPDHTLTDWNTFSYT